MNLNQRITEKTKLTLEKERLKRLQKGKSVTLKELMEEAVLRAFKK